MIELLRNVVRPKTAPAQKGGHQIANQNIVQHYPVNYLSKAAVFGARKTQQKC